VASSRFRALLLLVFLFLAALSLRRKSDLADRIEKLCEPARHLSLLAAPLAWLSLGEVRAAERNLLAGEEARRAAARAVLAAAQTSAAPSRRALAEGRGLVHAEVVDRQADDRDRLIVHFAPDSDVQPGAPVVCGDYYVGRVVSVADSRRGEGLVDLVTRQDARVGAEVVRRAAAGEASAPKEPSLLVVGGILPRSRRDDEVLLAVHCPSDPRNDPGEVRVHEIEPGKEGALAALADGFLLGTLEGAVRGGARVLGVRPGLDYRSGPSHVGILCPSFRSAAGPDLARDPFEDDRWLAARILLAGDASFWRETRLLSIGTHGGVLDGAAVAFGASLIGCVARAGERTSCVRLLGDPGLSLTVLAGEVDAAATASSIPVGRVVSLGRSGTTGEVLLLWDPSVRTGDRESTGPLEEGAGREVLLYTASGQRSVPPGLLLGRTKLPRGRGPFVLRVRQEDAGLALTRVSVWRAEGAPAGTGPDRPAASPPPEGDRRP
jgi:cell shape-determining protein MreC